MNDSTGSPSSHTVPVARRGGAARTGICGFFMGMADVVPGVSGGTVALILGLYGRLILAISHVDREFFGRLAKFDLRQASRHIDLLFLVQLAAGMAAGFIVTTFTVAKLLTDAGTRSFVQAIFFGLIVGSVWVVYRQIPRSTGGKRPRMWAIGLGALVAGCISWLPPIGSVGDPSLLFIFVCGCVAICAMILPGISGALILLLLGSYHFMLDAIKSILQGEAWGSHMPFVAVFVAGCLFGLLTFSKFLRRFLTRFPAPTLSLLCGLMLGSLFKLWPYQRDLTPEVEEFKHKVFWATWPPAIDGQLLALSMTMVGAAVMVLVIDRLARLRGDFGLWDRAESGN